ncbi:hypothetical protein D3C84_551830 [compost metagenome]
MAAPGGDLHDIDHFPVAVAAGVEAVALEAAVCLLLDLKAHAGAGLFEVAQLVFGVEGAVAQTWGPEQGDQPGQGSARGRPNGTHDRRGETRGTQGQTPDAKRDSAAADGFQIQQAVVVDIATAEPGDVAVILETVGRHHS